VDLTWRTATCRSWPGCSTESSRRSRAIVLFAAYRIGSRALKNAVLWAISLAAFVAIFAFHVPFPYIVLGGRALSATSGTHRSEKFSTGATRAPGRATDRH